MCGGQCCGLLLQDDILQRLLRLHGCGEQRAQRLSAQMGVGQCRECAEKQKGVLVHRRGELGDNEGESAYAEYGFDDAKIR